MTRPNVMSGPSLRDIVRTSAVALVAALAISTVSAQELEPYEESLEGTLVKFKMVPVPAGTLEWTNPETGEAETAEIQPIWIGVTEVTWDEYDVYMLKLDEGGGGSDAHGSEGDDENADPDAISRPSKPYGSPDLGWGHKGFPVMHVAYKGAEHYCKWLAAKTGKNYRLPTEAEWEYACRAGTLAAAPTEDADALDKVAWHWGNSDGQTHEVISKEPNAWGIYNMVGNVAEWVYGEERKHYVRGGSYYDEPADVHPGARAKEDTQTWQASDPQIPKSKWWLSDGSFVGFRVVCEQ
ncbi:MAG TPA: SUMF1/EgtB/PvdO family nonheme iron enzyme [Armatimonadota bacterium]|nr:SUMF1/EgtB/PvdO family nonheme iron enzyme [Armatimonadota bacterium]